MTLTSLLSRPGAGAPRRPPATRAGWLSVALLSLTWACGSGNDSTVFGFLDSDCDGIEDAADTVFDDTDGDGVGDGCDNCAVANPLHAAPFDCNGDGDTADLSEAAGQQCDIDGDGIGDACDDDRDADGILDDGAANGLATYTPCNGSLAVPVLTSCDDNCPLIVNGAQLDGDGDGLGDLCDP